MRALQLTRPGSLPELVEVPDPEPGPGQVRLRVAGAGACHSDLHVMEWEPVLYPLPFTLGHETTGWVDAVGPGVRGVTEGAAYAVYGPWGCGRCATCSRGAENYCEHAAEIGVAGPGLGRDGGMADYVLVDDARFLVPLGDLDPVATAPLTDAGLTPYHGIKPALPQLVPGSTAVVIGVGGLGHMAVQILRALTPATVVAVDTNADRLDHARQLGAHETLLSSDSTATAIRDLTGGLGAELVLDVVGVQATMDLAARVVRQEGRITVLGLGGGALPVGFGRVPWEVSVLVPYWGSRSELHEVIALAQAGLVHADVTPVPLEGMVEAYERMRAGEFRGRAVAVPGA